MNRQSSRGPVLIAGEGQPPGIMTSGNRDPYRCMQGLVKSCSRRGVTGSAHAHVQSTATRRPRPQAVRPAALRSCPSASLHGQVRAPLGPGGYCRHSGNGGLQTCLPAACSVAQARPSTAHLHQLKLKDPREGPGLAGRMTGTFLIRQAREEVERSRQGYLTRNP